MTIYWAVILSVEIVILSVEIVILSAAKNLLLRPLNTFPNNRGEQKKATGPMQAPIKPHIG
jgi:hypothetical protein